MATKNDGQHVNTMLAVRLLALPIRCSYRNAHLRSDFVLQVQLLADALDQV